MAVLEDLRAEWHLATLFASTDVLDALRDFVAKPSKEAFVRAATAMRADLGRGTVAPKY